MKPITPLSVGNYITGETANFKRWYYIKPDKIKELKALLVLFGLSPLYVIESTKYLDKPSVFIDGITLCKS